MSEPTGDAVARFVIDGEMTIYRAADLKTEVLEAVRKNAVLELDLSGISELDSAGLQVLMVAKQAATAAGHRLHLVAHSAAVIEIFEMLDMGAFFGDALLIPAASH
ncbi:STAS domain-containing protein [Rugamonas sp.]|uniref:STAS domain-containing protein n=1 Tax=Rugamonas sp. TaxID=1926287 RepID=UPI0025D7872E|nr:STAS domain-containing protein [Rugamonas sp.]